MMDISTANLSLFQDFKGIFITKSFFSLDDLLINEYLMTIEKKFRAFLQQTA
jgi:hypothetical protein